MDQIRKIDIFRQEASQHLPGFLYSFNIADLKRRNSHLGHFAGDDVIVELDELLTRMAPRSALVARTHGDRWHMLTSRDETDHIRTILKRYMREEPFSAGWEMRATKDGERKTIRKAVATTLRLAVRCLYAKVETAAELDSAIKQMGVNDYGLPVNRPIALSDIGTMKRKNWSCVARYPDEDPSCPFCGGAAFNWKDGDDTIYSGDGTCKGCGAEVSLIDMSRPRG